MKKIVSLAIMVMMAISASAVTIVWGGSASTAKLYGLTDGTAMTAGTDSETAGLTMYYIDYTLYDTVQAMTDGETTLEAQVAAIATLSAVGPTSASASGRVKQTAQSPGHDAGESYFARAFATFSGKDYYIDLFGGTGANGVWTITQSGNDTVTEQFAWKDATYGGATGTRGSTNAWVPVPEPSVGLLALAGIGMLIRRKRA